MKWLANGNVNKCSFDVVCLVIIIPENCSPNVQNNGLGTEHDFRLCETLLHSGNLIDILELSIVIIERSFLQDCFFLLLKLDILCLYFNKRCHNNSFNYKKYMLDLRTRKTHNEFDIPSLPPFSKMSHLNNRHVTMSLHYATLFQCRPNSNRGEIPRNRQTRNWSSTT